jgi:uncharacterized protein YbjQ (UPF0145 family)
MIVTTTPSVDGKTVREYLGVDIDYETLKGSMLMVTASGTAVKVE